MNPELIDSFFEWALLLTRWLHITVGITWIGTSIFFMWLDRTFQFNKASTSPGHVGDLWMVHGGGFYHVEKLKMGATKVSPELHWFKWESYWTFMSGALLLWLMFYASGGAMLLDVSVSSLSYWQALGVAVSSIAVSWLFYDLVWENKFVQTTPVMGHTLTLAWFAAASHLLCHTLSGRAAYMHIGAMLGTWMTGNVFLRIIPRQVKMVEATKEGKPVNEDWSRNAKNRSSQNTYFTLPVIFIMLSNHFPSTYGHSLNWLVLLIISAAGAAMRHYFLIRLQNPSRARSFLALGMALIVGAIVLTKEVL